jgi:Phage capsid protein
MASLLNTGISNPGQNLSSGDRDALFMKMFSGEVLTAFTRTSVMMPRHMVRTIPHGKSASFPVMGRTNAKYLAAGDSLDDQRTKMENTEKVITIDGLLTADCLITDIDDAMNHFDVRTEYSRQLGEALAQSADCAIINELANTGVMGENIPTNSALKNEGTGKSYQFVTGLSEATTVEYGNKLLEGLINARAQFTKNWVPQGDRYFLTSPEGFSAICRALMPDAANFAAIFDPTTGKLKNVCGFEIVETPNFLNAGVDGKHALNSKISAAGLEGIAFHRSAVGTVKLKDLAMERARRAEYQADQIIAKYSMGHGGLRPEAVGLFVKSAIA